LGGRGEQQIPHPAEDAEFGMTRQGEEKSVRNGWRREGFLTPWNAGDSE